MAQQAPPSRGVRNKSCLQEALGQTGRQTSPQTGEWLLHSRKVRATSGRRLGWEAGIRWAEDPQGTSGCGPGFREEQRGHRISGETQGSPKEGKGCPARPKEGQKSREEIRKRKGQEEVVFPAGSANIYCVFMGPGLVLSPGESETNEV